MKKWLQCAAGVAMIAGLTSLAKAQVPGAPAAAAPAAPAAAAVGAGGFVEPKGIECIEKAQVQWDKCKRKICQTVFGQMINNMTKPATLFTGGLIPPCCPETPSAKELAEAVDDPGPLGAAAAIAADEANAKKRRAAVRYLGTVDCHWWPEAEKALIVALRTDRNECVRMEAACSLGNGCCCTRRTIAALAIAVEGSEKDGNPSENSERVRFNALNALNHCLCCFREVTPLAAPIAPEETKRVSAQAAPAKLSARANLESKSKVVLPAFYYELDKKDFAAIIVEARKVARSNNIPDNSLVTGQQTLLNVILDNAPSFGAAKSMSINGEEVAVTRPDAAAVAAGNEPPALGAAFQTETVVTPVPVPVQYAPAPAPVPVKQVTYTPAPAPVVAPTPAAPPVVVAAPAPTPVVAAPAPTPVVAAPAPVVATPAPIAAPAPVVVPAPAFVPPPVPMDKPVTIVLPEAMPVPVVETPAPAAAPVVEAAPAVEAAPVAENVVVPAATSEVVRTENVPLEDVLANQVAEQPAAAPANAPKAKSEGLMGIFRRNGTAPEAAKPVVEAPVAPAAQPAQYRSSWVSTAPAKAEAKPAVEVAPAAPAAYHRSYATPAQEAAAIAQAVELATSDPQPARGGYNSWSRGGVGLAAPKEIKPEDATRSGYHTWSEPSGAPPKAYTAATAAAAGTTTLPTNNGTAEGYHSFSQPNAPAPVATAPVPTEPLAPGSAPYRRSWSR